MNVDLAFSGSIWCVESLVKFLKSLEGLTPQPVGELKVVMGDDQVIYVKAGFTTEEDAWRAGEQMSEVSADLVEDTNILVVLAPFSVDV
jgi:hypothetical protein